MNKRKSILISGVAIFLIGAVAIVSDLTGGKVLKNGV
jgi:hypothetical protein